MRSARQIEQDRIDQIRRELPGDQNYALRLRAIVTGWTLEKVREEIQRREAAITREARA